MKTIKQCAVVVRRPQDVWEGTRTALGLAAHNFWANLFVLDVEVEMTEALKENLEWLAEMECTYISNLKANARHGFEYMPWENLVRHLEKMDLIIPFGDRN
jgi:hypothetical protein